MKQLILILFLFFFSPLSQALTFSKLGGTFLIRGEIEKGDFHAFLKKFAEWERAPTVFEIDSPGGALNEAIEIGSFIRKSQIPVWVWNECSSACVFIYASAVERYVKGKIGLHRPYFDSKYFSSLTSSEAESKYNELKLNASLYLKHAGVKQNIIHKMFSTSSKDIHYISGDDANKEFGVISDFYEEWIISKCGAYTTAEQKVITSIGDLNAARMTAVAMQDQNIDKADDFGSNLEELWNGAQLALELDRNGMLQPYAEKLEKRSRCIDKSTNAHILEWHLVLKENLVEVLEELNTLSR
ncbi:MAG: hypothetical protein CML20_11520 [Rheinheimera sp.]|nr:hypothetical protein [Rheinheimera sp.]